MSGKPKSGAAVIRSMKLREAARALGYSTAAAAVKAGAMSKSGSKLTAPPKTKPKKHSAKQKKDAAPVGTTHKQRAANRRGTCVDCGNEDAYLLSVEQALCGKCYRAKHPNKPKAPGAKKKARKGKRKADDVEIPVSLEQELAAMRIIAGALAGLSPTSTRRAIGWAARVYLGDELLKAQDGGSS